MLSVNILRLFGLKWVSVWYFVLDYVIASFVAMTFALNLSVVLEVFFFSITSFCSAFSFIF